MITEAKTTFRMLLPPIFVRLFREVRWVVRELTGRGEHHRGKFRSFEEARDGLTQGRDPYLSDEYARWSLEKTKAWLAEQDKPQRLESWTYQSLAATLSCITNFNPIIVDFGGEWGGTMSN